MEPCPQDQEHICQDICGTTAECRKKLANCPQIRNQLDNIETFTNDKTYAETVLKAYCDSKRTAKRMNSPWKYDGDKWEDVRETWAKGGRRKRRRNTKKKRRSNKKK
jgi:hypothetical protein